jgi:hypothetical protein
MIAVFLGIAGFIMTHFNLWNPFSQELQGAIMAASLVAIIFALTAYIIFRETGKKHRCAQAVHHLHFVNHTVRDYLSGKLLGNSENFSDVIRTILDSISAAFSIIEGRHCRCSIKSFEWEAKPTEQEAYVETSARDSISEKTTSETTSTVHLISENTDFESLLYVRNGCVRYFHEGKLPNQ